MPEYRDRTGKGLCPRCGEPKDRKGQSYCRACHNAYSRANRPKYRDLSEEGRKRSIARSYANVMKRRGKIHADICFWCGVKENIEMHHPDIDKNPKIIIPLCSKCHKQEHKKTH